MKHYSIIYLLLAANMLQASLSKEFVQCLSGAVGILSFLNSNRTPTTGSSKALMQSPLLDQLRMPYSVITARYPMVGKILVSSALSGITYNTLFYYSAPMLYDAARSAYKGNCMLHDFAHIAQESPEKFFQTINIHYSSLTTTCFTVYQKYLNELARLKYARTYARRIKYLESPDSKLFYDADRLLLLIEEKQKLIEHVLGLLKKCPDLAREKRDIQIDSLALSARLITYALVSGAAVYLYNPARELVQSIF